MPVRFGIILRMRFSVIVNLGWVFNSLDIIYLTLPINRYYFIDLQDKDILFNLAYSLLYMNYKVVSDYDNEILKLFPGYSRRWWNWPVNRVAIESRDFQVSKMSSKSF